MGVASVHLRIQLLVPTSFLLVSCASLADSIGTGSADSQRSLPSGWRAPLQLELSAERCGLRPDTPLELLADFNGDGSLDLAMIAVDPSRNRTGLLVRISSGQVDGWKIAEEIKGTCATFGLETAEPGVYRAFVCLASAKTCDPTSKQSIRMKFSGISLFALGSAGTTYFWNSNASGFDRIWEGD